MSLRQTLTIQIEQAVLSGRGAIRVLRERGPSQIQFWFIALAVGIAAGGAALLFRKGIEELQAFLYQAPDIHGLTDHVPDLPWAWVLGLPVAGGLAVGLILHLLTPDGRVRSVADVIEGAAMNSGRVEKRAGIASALASLITLSSGGSSGREGPVVHLAAVISSWVSNRMNADGITGRDLLGCAVAAAVSASFNAPIAGALFALEVILRHFAIHAFAPIVIASAAGTVINRLEYGGVTEFRLPAPGSLDFYVELPAFLILGLLSGLVAVLLIKALFWAEDLGNAVQSRLRLHRALRPALAGAMLGALALAAPHIIGVGYETTSAALTGQLVLHEAVVFALLKGVAVCITIAGRMGGGVFSPSLMIGALLGLSFGIVATGILPDLSGSETLYALAGMGAVAASVLGAPISTTLIVFELTGDWQTGLAVMVSVSMSTALSTRLVKRSYFLNQLERRNLNVAAGPQEYLKPMIRAGSQMRPVKTGASDDPALAALVEAGHALSPDTKLDRALPLFDRLDTPVLPVLIPGDAEVPPRLVGVLHHTDALKAYIRSLETTAAEEHS